MLKFLAVPVAILGCTEFAQATSCADASCEAEEIADDVSLLQLRLGDSHRTVAQDHPVRDPVRKERGIPYFQSRDLDQEPKGKLNINVDGEIVEAWLPGATTFDNFSTVEYRPPYRFYLTKTYTTDYSNKDNFYMPNYIGKTFSVDFDFGENGPQCGCNLNFYLVGMPANSPGQYGDWYCDAQCFEGLGCCYEWDMNEGSMEVQQITNHACTGKGSYPGHPDWVCHKWGDPESKTTQQEFSPGPGHTIDSKKPFTYEQVYSEDGNGDAIIVTKMIQGSAVLKKQQGPGNQQLNAMFKRIKEGMVFVTGYWSDAAMNWLDSDECGNAPENCNMNPARLSNFKLTTNSAGSPTPAPDAPTASPSGGKCCYQSCDGSNCGGGITTGWCGQSEDNCGTCDGGTWCAAAPPAPPAPPAPASSGQCCYENCDENNCGGGITTGWCGESKDNCGTCPGGTWCAKKPPSCCYQSCATGCTGGINTGFCSESEDNCGTCGGGVWCDR